MPPILMTDIAVRLAGAGDAHRLDAGLARLSEDLGDVHAATAETLALAGWRPSPVFRAQMAESGNGDLVGVALYSPCFSTTRGGAGIYVSDLWTAAAVRGQGLGRRLLAAALQDGEAIWGAGFIKLSVYHSSPDALRFYNRMGFSPLGDQHDLILDAAGCAAMKGGR